MTMLKIVIVDREGENLTESVPPSMKWYIEKDGKNAHILGEFSSCCCLESTFQRKDQGDIEWGINYPS